MRLTQTSKLMVSSIGYKFKHQEDEALFHKLDLSLKFIFLDICAFCAEQYLPQPVITMTISNPLPHSTSDIHSQGRAIDFRSWLYSADQMSKILKFTNDKYAEEFGTSPDMVTPLCIIYEDPPNNQHMHLQVRRNCNIAKLNLVNYNCISGTLIKLYRECFHEKVLSIMRRLSGRGSSK